MLQSILCCYYRVEVAGMNLMTSVIDLLCQIWHILHGLNVSQEEFPPILEFKVFLFKIMFLQRRPLRTLLKWKITRSVGQIALTGWKLRCRSRIPLTLVVAVLKKSYTLSVLSTTNHSFCSFGRSWAEMGRDETKTNENPLLVFFFFFTSFNCGRVMESEG